MGLKEKIDDWKVLQFAQSKNELKPTLNYVKINEERTVIVPLGDLHLGSKFFDEELLKKNIDWCYKKKAKLILMGDMVECMDLDTKILTEHGWKEFKDLKKNEKVMTFNKDNNCLELQQPTKRVLYKYRGAMYNFKNKKLDMMVTPEHRILCRHHKGKLKVRKANEFSIIGAKSRCWNIPVSGDWTSDEYQLKDDWIKLIGWILTEGWCDVRGNSIRYYISQSKVANTKNYNDIKKILNNLNIIYKERVVEETGVCFFRLSAKTPILKDIIGINTKQIPRLILDNFSCRQLKVLFDVLLKGDGGKRGEFFTSSTDFKDDFLELCLKIGKLTSVSFKENTHKGIYIIYTGDGQGNKSTKKMMHKTITNLNIVEFDDYVWCVAVPNSFLIVKRNDCVFITGNTATRDSVGAGVYEQNEILDKQIEHIVYLLKPLATNNQILGIHPGNHEFRVYKHSGLNITKSMARELGIKYLGWGKLHYLLVGNQGYTIYTTHGASGARLPHTKIKGALDLANLADAEIYCMGHLHQLSHHVRNYYTIDKRSKTVVESQKHFLLTGSYLNHWGSYAHMKSYEPMRKGSPKIKLDGKEHQIRVSL